MSFVRPPAETARATSAATNFFNLTSRCVSTIARFWMVPNQATRERIGNSITVAIIQKKNL